MQERDQVAYVLDLLKDQMDKSSSDTAGAQDIARLPSYITLLHAHALRGVFYPSNFMYPITVRFLLQRPELDVHDLPMLYGMLYSSGDDWKKERGWMVRFLIDGMASSDDWKLLKRRRTWDLLASLFESAVGDRALRHGILEVSVPFANLLIELQSLMEISSPCSFWPTSPAIPKRQSLSY
jgi:nucleolar pre-ribosomal-associated protein 1